tara:strand:- start:5903 stop:6286 length:384 start_codon:yes stop_codon:yes gene_type:complete
MKRLEMEWVIGGIIGLLIGIGGTKAVDAVNKKNAPPIIIEDVRGQKEQEVVKQLTNLDVALQICQDNKTPGICRELICYQFGKGVGSQTSQKQCEAVTNINNSIILYDYCKTQNDFDRCIDIFWRRK